MDELPSTEQIQSEVVALKEDFNELLRLLIAWCGIAVLAGNAGAASSPLVNSDYYVETLAKWHEKFGHLDDSGIEPEMKVGYPDIQLLRAILDTPDPAHWREVAANEGLSAGQVKRRAGSKKKYKTQEKLATMSAKWLPYEREGYALFQVPLNEQSPDKPLDVVLDVKEPRK